MRRFCILSFLIASIALCAVFFLLLFSQEIVLKTIFVLCKSNHRYFIECNVSYRTLNSHALKNISDLTGLFCIVSFFALSLYLCLSTSLSLSFSSLCECASSSARAHLNERYDRSRAHLYRQQRRVLTLDRP